MFLSAVVGKLLFGGTIGRGIVNGGNDIAPCGTNGLKHLGELKEIKLED